MRRILNFKSMIAPTKSYEFFENYWEKKVLVSRGKSGRFKGLISMHDVEFLVSTTLSMSPWIRFVSNKTELGAEYYFSPAPLGVLLPDREKIAERFKRGDTIVLNFLEYRWDPVKKLCCDLGKSFNLSASANMYLTPASAQGFQAHRDQEEIFILQIEGEKLWRFYDYPLEYPLPGHDKSPFYKIDRTPIIEVVLKPGDCVYIPRGYVHEALTTNKHSLHLTVSIRGRSWVELLHKMALDEPTLRQSIPKDFFMSVSQPVLGKETLYPHVALLENAKKAEKALNKIRENISEAQTDKSLHGFLTGIIKEGKRSKTPLAKQNVKHSS